ncbi:hypothetical protein MMC11_007636 [Xylographa trunciseda]|nr:hypothetical protein [Xylographa trunciseda]
MSESAEDDSLKTLQRINQKLRQAVVASFPTAYLPKATGITADIRNMIQCNESMLVDSMIPLDKVMLGPTGKSVHRSYMTALDMLIPRKTDIGSVDVDKDFNSESASKYSQAMRFLRSKESILTPDSEIKGTRIQQVRDKLQGQGIQGTVVDRYVEKQLEWSVARGEWDAVRSEALEARESSRDQSAGSFSARQKNLKRVCLHHGVLHARWMDWVVNGDKYRVEYCFSIVDRDSIMARIERGREATRDAMLTSIDGTEWPQVTLEPRNWAALCRAKAVAWATRNPMNPAHVQLRLDSLKRMKQAYEVYEAQLDNRSKAQKPKKKTSDALTESNTAETARKAEEDSTARTTEDLLNKLTSKANSVKDLYEKLLAIDTARTDLTALETALTTATGAIPQVPADIKIKEDAVTKKKGEIVTLEGEAVRLEILGGPLAHEEEEIKQALEEIYRYDKEAREYREAGRPDEEKTANGKLEAAKTRWLNANKSLQALGTKGSVLELEAGGVETMKTSTRGNLRSLVDEINAAQAQLAISSPGAAPNAVVGVNEKDKSLILASEAVAPTAAATAPASGQEEESADVGTKISFSVGSKTDTASTTESNVSGAFNVEVGNWFTKVKASSSFSSSSKKLEKSMSDCRVEGSFSAMLVNIKRPWLHGELFNDFDVDIPTGSQLSPGAEKIKQWVDVGDNKVGPVYRTDYGKFPAYPTAFIVAADTVLEGLKTGGSLKTESKESSQKLEVKDGALRIAFQAPQIVGWVSEILPQLPRNLDAGGLTGTPNKAFRI